VSALRTLLRTPHRSVFEADLRAVRVQTESGQVGLRPGGEPMILVVEPGLVLLHFAERTAYAATSGGLLRSTRDSCELYTPFALVGSEESALLAALERALDAPDSELLARRQLSDLEQRIVRELGPRVALPRPFR
jgi:F0F1-type ATP synthase epsilon subunit